ncbi:unnamed protein product, partial [Mesorhabditis spiculigera]
MVLTLPQFRNNFGALCLSQNVANIFVLILFACWCAPVQFFFSGDLAAGFFGKLMGQLNQIFWHSLLYSHVVMSLNRFSAIVFPGWSNRLHARGSTYLLIGTSWAIAAVSNIPYFFRDSCYMIYVPQKYAWQFSDNFCGHVIGIYMDCYAAMLVVIVLILLDIYTILHLKRLHKGVIKSTSSAELRRRRGLEIRFFMQVGV